MLTDIIFGSNPIYFEVPVTFDNLKLFDDYRNSLFTR
jgi:hypothetical protein